jgi:ubiquinone/menaquinone biosynthesis C-methylase UbiE
LVVSIGVLQALQNPPRALHEMTRILRPHGLLVVEFLNAFEPIALVKNAVERIRGRLPRVRAYSPFQVQRWFAECGLRLVQRANVYLPPRNLPWLEPIISKTPVIDLLDGIPGLSIAGAHAFLFAGKKGGS